MNARCQVAWTGLVAGLAGVGDCAAKQTRWQVPCSLGVGGGLRIGRQTNRGGSFSMSKRQSGPRNARR